MSKRSIVAIIVIGILAVAIPAGLFLVQQQQIFKPRAEEGRSACFIDESKCVYIDYAGCDGDPHDGQHDHCWYDCAASECATPEGTVTTCKGEKTIAQLTSELQGAGYPGPWDTNSMIAAYNRAACPDSAVVPSGTICENDPPGAVGVLSSKLQEQVHWVADCNKFCPNNDRPNRGGCPKNPATDFAVSRDDSAWCWGFDSSGTNRCLQLQPGRACTLDWFGNSSLSSSCVSCITGRRPDVEQHYRGPAGQVNCSTRRIINDWCTKVDPGGCNPIKSGQCASECGISPPPTISASPNPVPAGAGAGTTTVTWSGAPGTGQVRVYEPAGSTVCSPTNQCNDPSWQGASGSFTFTTVETGHTYIFSLYKAGCTKADCSDQGTPKSVTVTRAGVFTQCFFVSENQAQTNGLLSCGQSGAIPYTQNPQTVSNFQLSSGNGVKTLYVRFLNLAAGESITNCNDPNKCKDSQHQITLAAQVGSCACSTDICPSSCALHANKLSSVADKYSDPYKCFLADNITNTSPTPANKNTWCNSPKRTKGDANNDNNVDITDYTLWLRAANGGKVPPDKNPDFSGDGEVGRSDLDIWQAGRGQ